MPWTYHLSYHSDLVAPISHTLLSFEHTHSFDIVLLLDLIWVCYIFFIYINKLNRFTCIDASSNRVTVFQIVTVWQKSVELDRDSNHGSFVIRTNALPVELTSLHNSVIQILGFLLTNPASMISSTYCPEAESLVARVRAWYKGCGRVHVYMFATTVLDVLYVCCYVWLFVFVTL